MATTAPAPLDAAALTELLDGTDAAVRRQVRDVLCRPSFAPVGELLSGEYRKHVFSLLQELAAEGTGTALGFPERYGGAGNVGGSVAAFETLAHGDLSLLVKLGVQYGLWGGAVLHLGTEKHHDRYLRAITSLELPGCFAMTEAGHGSDVQSLRTTATYDGGADEFVIQTPDGAYKEYIGNAAVHGRAAAVFAQLVVAGESHGVHALVVPLRDEHGATLPGIRIEDSGHKLGLNGVDNGRIWFDGVRVGRDALLDRYAQVGSDGIYASEIENPDKRFFTMLGTLVQGRVSVGGASISGAKSALTIAVRHALRRRQFGPPDGDHETVLLDYRTHQRRLLPALAKTYGLHFAQDEVRGELHRVFTGAADVTEEDRRRLEARAAGLKAIASWHATHTIQECREACGGLGYLSENRFAALKADTDVFTTFEGDNTVLLQLVAKSLLTGYRQQFSSLAPIDMVGFVAGQVLETVVEKSAARELFGRLRDDLTRRGRQDDVLEGDDQIELLRWREEHILSGVARRLKRGIDDGGDPYQVFLDCQDHVVALAHAHVECFVLEAFASAVERCEDPALKATLDRLCDLHALATIEADRAWFQEHGRLSSTRSKGVTRAVNRLCAEVRDDALGLVDAFAIPDAVLAAPIGLKDPPGPG